MALASDLVGLAHASSLVLLAKALKRAPVGIQPFIATSGKHLTV
jgi:hypothetical protein